MTGQETFRHDRLIREHTHDPYKARLKLKDPSFCPQCGAVYEGDRWHWGRVPEGASEQRCQACQRINDRYPAGEVHLSGDFLAAHHDEIVQLAHNQQQQESAEHPLNRIIGIEDHPEGMVITTTDVHLPRRIGQALHHAYKGELEVQYDEEGCFVRVNWHRSDR